jgi:hypothetical protein
MNVLRDYAPNAVATYAYARHALVDALSRSGVMTGSTVALPSFICRDVLASVHALGAEATYYDVDESLRPVNLDSFPPSKAILAVNYFGFPQDLAAFTTYCSRTGAMMIEDNAHGLFSRDATGSLLGTRGDFGILSMRKTFHVSTGAALIAPPGTDLPLSSPCTQGADARLDRVRFVLSQWERKTSIPFMPVMRSTIRTARRIAGRPAVVLSTTSEERRLPSHHAIGCTSQDVLNNQDPSLESTRRRRLFDTMMPLVGNTTGVSLLHDRLDDGVVPYGIPFRADAGAVRAVEELARRYHVSAMQWPALPEAVAASAPQHYRNVWLVNFI